MENEKKNKIVHFSVIFIFVFLYLFVSLISTTHAIEFFQLSNPSRLMAIALAAAFEVGAAASLASLVILDRMNQTLVWLLFITLTAIQAMSNAYFAYEHLENFTSWVELFGLTEWPEMAQKRLLAVISGAILPLIALGFIKSLVDYIKPKTEYEYVDENDNMIDSSPNKMESKEFKDLSKEKTYLRKTIDKKVENKKILDKTFESPEDKNIINYLNSDVEDNQKSKTKKILHDSVEKINNKKDLESKYQETVNDHLWEMLEDKKEKMSSKEKIEEFIDHYQQPLDKNLNKVAKKLIKSKIDNKSEKEQLKKSTGLPNDMIEYFKKPENKIEKKQNGIITESYKKTKEKIEERTNKQGLPTNLSIEKGIKQINDNKDITEDELKNLYGEKIPQKIKNYFDEIQKKKAKTKK